MPALFLIFMANLQLPLTKQWFDLTKSGVKTEDYREINLYWFKRLVYRYKDVLLYKGFHYNQISDKGIYSMCTHPLRMFGFVPFEENIMTLGYPKSEDSERILKLEHKGIEIRTGNPEWGAEPDKLYFVIKHGVFLA